MGLLLGDIETAPIGKVASIWDVSVLTRSDKRKDRVEISPEQLAAASTHAEKVSSQVGKTTRVIGWYHSHPHITVHPSHVDVRTQGSYQMLDDCFVGLIFSCFNTDQQLLKGQVQVIGFQSINKPSNVATFDFREGEKDFQNNQQVAVEIPLYVVPNSHKMNNNVWWKLIELQSIILREEYASYINSLYPSHGSQTTHPLITLHSNGVYQKALCRLLEFAIFPLLQTLRDRQLQNSKKVKELRDEKARLEAQLRQMET